MALTPDMRRSIDQIRDDPFGGVCPDSASNPEHAEPPSSDPMEALVC